jgi:hypothetical protein
MLDLHVLFLRLEAASRSGEFESELMKTPLADAHIHGHPLGFRVARINHGEMALRLHLWKAAVSEQPGFEVHDHMFDLTSHVVQGAIGQKVYKFADDQNGTKAIYSVAYEAGKSVIVKTSRRGELVLERAERFYAGTTYRLDAGELHIAERLDDDDAITLALTKTKLDSATTIGPWEGELQLQSSRRRLDDRTLREIGLDLALHV